MSEWQETDYGLVPREWSLLSIGELSEKVTDGAHFSPKPQNVGKYMCSVKDMTYNRFDLSGCKLISIEDFDKLSEQGCKPKKGDILISKDGANCLDIIFVFNQSEDIVLLSSIAIVRLLPVCDSNFVRYFLLSSACQFTMRSNYVSGSAIPRVVLKDFKKVPIIVPDLIEQKAIANVLSSLDDKIDLLHRQNKTLEAMAETLFRQWFVEDAKEDWDELTLSQICTVITKGTTPTTLGHAFVDVGINFIKAESINDDGSFIFDKFAKITEDTHQFLKRSVIENGDVLCSIAGTIGRVAIVDESIIPANTNQAIAIIRVNRQKYFPIFVYLYLKSSLFQEVMDGKIVHAVQPNLSLGEIGNTTLKIAPPNQLREFEMIVNPIFDKKRRNTYQIRTLEKLRDTLLPKLMSGEVRVSYEPGTIT
jgi:type I restriction enzyme S subunit